MRKILFISFLFCSIFSFGQNYNVGGNSTSLTSLTGILPIANGGTGSTLGTKVIQIETKKELVASIPITQGNNLYTAVVYSVKLPALVKAGQVLSITSRLEVTNTYAYNIGVGRFMKIAGSSGDSWLLYDTANYVTQPVEESVTPNNHHWVLDGSRNYYVKNDINNGYINVVVYAVASLSNVAWTDLLTVEPGYGHLDVVILPIATQTFSIVTNNTDLDVQNWVAKLPVAPTQTFTTALTTFVQSCKAHGNWDGLDRMWVFATEHQADAMVDVKTGYTLTETPNGGTLTWTAKQGYAGDGVKSYINLNYTPTIDAHQLRLNSVSLIAYVRTVRSANTNYLIGTVIGGSDKSLYLVNRYTGDLAYGASNSAYNISGAVTTSAGLFAVQRTTSTLQTLYHDGVSIGTDTHATDGISNYSMVAGALNTANVIGNFTLDQISFIAIGDGTINMATFNTDFQTFRTAIGF